MGSGYRDSSKKFIGFRYAFKGIVYAIKHERNMKIHLLATFIVLIVSIYTQITPIEWAVLLLTCALVLSLEIMNTAIEVALNYIEPSKQEAIGIAKDLAAGAVFIAAIFSITIACFIFIPYWI
ncbi:diacylglycerol kinase family protein [Gracilibacillus marinus]|jgi:diacylglycerol kinase|uniref:Diacylglycerol kinase family protein n=1 Tax=Gracilibacillus marinus TaxID=630535 RepID=A0ABV8VZR6_9BACI